MKTSVSVVTSSPSTCSLPSSEESNRPLTPILFEKYRDTSPISIMIFRNYMLPFWRTESSTNTTNLHHDTGPICIATLVQKYQGQPQGSLEHSQQTLRVRWGHTLLVKDARVCVCVELEHMRLQWAFGVESKCFATVLTCLQAACEDLRAFTCGSRPTSGCQIDTTYASWAPTVTFWPFLRSSARHPTIRAVRGTVAIKGIFDN